MQATRSLTLLLVAALGIGATQTATAASQEYPSRPIRLIIPNAAGAAVDTLGRIFANTLTQVAGQQIVVDYRGGAGGLIGMEIGKDAIPDGYTLLSASTAAMVIGPHIHKKLPFDPMKDYAFISLFGITPNIVVVNPSIPVKSLKELIALAKARPGELNFGTAGTGSTSHMAMELFQSVAKIKMTHVPYKGTGPAMIELIGGHLSLMFDVIMTSLPHVQSGKLRTLALSSLQRSSITPQVPTIAESGYPGFEAIVWFGLFAPTGTPPDIIKKVGEDTARILATPAMRELLASQGADIVASTPTVFTTRVNAEIVKWRKVIQDAGIKPE